jgi:hypothetical protein
MMFSFSYSNDIAALKIRQSPKTVERLYNRRIFEGMRTRYLASPFIFLTVILCSAQLSAQGMPVDSVLLRIGSELHSPALAEQLKSLLPDYANQHVWGLAIGDFTNDSLPDLAVSLYDPFSSKSEVRIYLFENQNNQKLVNRFEEPVTFIESPIEVGLTIDGSVVTIVQKTGEEHWSQRGYSIEFGDVVLVDRDETEKEDVTASHSAKARSIGHNVYRNYETLRSHETYFTGSSGDAMFSTSYYTLPSYQRNREIYPGYGHFLSDTSSDYIVEGAGLRRNASDLSIAHMETAYNDEYLYLSVRVNDDYVVGGQKRPEANDRLSLWFDTKYTGDRLDRDRRLLSKEGGFPTFRNRLDSLVYNVSFALPAEPGKITEISYSTLTPLTLSEQDGLKNIRAQLTYDTASGVVNGYTIRLRIPFTFLGFETNPAKLYETHAPVINGEEQTTPEQQNGIGEAATLGFTALVYDIDDPAHPNEVTVEATSKYEQGNPSTFGTLVLEPSSLYYGEVHPTYLDKVRMGLVAAGY